MTTEIKRGDRRDLAADLAICEAATLGPWRYEDGDVDRCDPRPAVLTYFDYENGEWFIHADFADKDDAIFSAEAREGWPHSIRRAIEAEAALTEWKTRAQEAEDLAEYLRDENERLRNGIVYALCAGDSAIIRARLQKVLGVSEDGAA